MQWQKDDFMISDDKSKIDLNAVYDFLSISSYWAENIPKPVVQRSIENSLCFGVYLHEKQIGFARVVTDFATFGYLADVFILPEQRSKGLSKWMMQLIIDHPQLQGLRRFTLATRDAHNYMLNLDLLRLISLNDGCNDTIPMSIRMRFSTQADFPILNRKLQAVFMMIK